MALLYEKVSAPLALFGPCPHWPRWRAATVQVSLASSFTDATYNGFGEENLQGGDTMESLGGTITTDRWPASVRDGTALSFANMLLQEGQRSHGPEDGALYTQVGAFAFPEGLVVGGSVGTVGIGLSWQIKPELEIPPGVPPPGGILSRGRPDGRLMEMLCPASGLGFAYSWEAEVSSDVGELSTRTVNATGFVPVEFELEALAVTTYNFSKTLTTVITYHPPDDDPDIGYYPMRGSSTLAATASVTLTFIT